MHPERQSQARVVTAQRPTHVWHVDLTTVPTPMGFWCSWLPFAVPQCWPWCWWLGLVLDHYSRRIMGVAIFGNAPASVEIQSLLGRAIHAAGTAPKYLISDKGPQFWPTRGYAKWCRAHGIKPRFGAIGKHGSIAIMERAIRSLKESARRIAVPFRRQTMRRALDTIVGWYNAYRPNSGLLGRTPDEVYFGRFPAHRRPRIEPRPNWPRASPCAKPTALVAGKPGTRFDIEVERLGGHRQLPIVRLRRAA